MATKKTRPKHRTESITVSALLVDLPLDTTPPITDIVIHRMPMSDDDTDTSVLLTIPRAEIIRELLQMYGDWSYTYNATISPTGVYNYTAPQYPELTFLGLWGDYVSYNMANWSRQLTALLAKYNPLHNYDRYEDKDYSDSRNVDMTTYTTDDAYGYGTSGGVTTNSYSQIYASSVNINDPSRNEDGSISTGSGTISGAPMEGQAGVVTQNKSTTYDDTTSVDTTSSTTTGAPQDISNTTAYSKDLRTMDTNQKGWDTVTHKDNNYHIYGNIGVTTSAAMVREILETYNVNFLHKIVDEFAHRYLVLLPTDDEDWGCCWAW